MEASPNEDFLYRLQGCEFRTVLADPPWRFKNKSGKASPEYKKITRYATMELSDLCRLPVRQVVANKAHLYLWVPNALLPEGLMLMSAWGFEYKSNIIWHKVRKDGGSDGRGVGYYFRNVTEMLLFGIRGIKDNRTEAPGRLQVNYMKSIKREHSRKPDEQYDVIEACSRGPYLELFRRGEKDGWTGWGFEANLPRDSKPRLDAERFRSLDISG